MAARDRVLPLHLGVQNVPPFFNLHVSRRTVNIAAWTARGFRILGVGHTNLRNLQKLQDKFAKSTDNIGGYKTADTTAQIHFTRVFGLSGVLTGRGPKHAKSRQSPRRKDFMPRLKRYPTYRRTNGETTEEFHHRMKAAIAARDLLGFGYQISQIARIVGISHQNTQKYLNKTFLPVGDTPNNCGKRRLGASARFLMSLGVSQYGTVRLLTGGTGTKRIQTAIAMEDCQCPFVKITTDTELTTLDDCVLPAKKLFFRASIESSEP